ncbi:hypothetical protein CVT91_09590 [Candidatus Atribacteria bacterium HGW-Atribacteria-1]|nr:MAG: hypothetical protein CVT91_09590 [Candidatus Atribacteria bacterium HGW-Atribacteria-1]
MGRDLTLYPSKASKKELKNLVESLGFVKCSHLWDWPKGTLNYSWFDMEDFKSIDGVSADIYPIKEDKKDKTDNVWALHVRNLFSASFYDVKMLNRLLREARKKFGGTIYGDYGKNRYAPLWEDTSTPISRGISMVYEEVLNRIKKVEFSIPDPKINYESKENDDLTFITSLNQMDPTRDLYNGLVPFAVSAFEFFFSQIFQILLKYDDYSIEKLKNYNQKIDFYDLLLIKENKKTIEGVIAGNYSFQNINQINKAFKEWLGTDIRSILFKKKKIGKNVAFLENKISEIINFRHKIIHHFLFDNELTREKLINIFSTIKISFKEVVNALEDKYSIKIENHS